MPLYKEQGIVLRSVKLGEADKIVSILTQGSGKVRAVAKGIRRTNSKFGARLEPLTHVSLMLYAGRNLDIVTQAEIISPFRGIRAAFDLIAAGETMLEAMPNDSAATAESFLLKLLSLSGFHPSLSACAVCGSPGPHELFAAGLGGVVCASCGTGEAGPVSLPAVRWLDGLARVDLVGAGDMTPDPVVRREARAMLYGFTEYYLERRMRSFALLAR